MLTTFMSVYRNKRLCSQLLCPYIETSFVFTTFMSLYKNNVHFQDFYVRIYKPASVFTIFMSVYRNQSAPVFANFMSVYRNQRSCSLLLRPHISHRPFSRLLCPYIETRVRDSYIKTSVFIRDFQVRM